jgi:anti-anti-sigma factor
MLFREISWTPHDRAMDSFSPILLQLPDRIDTWTIHDVESSFQARDFEAGVSVIADMRNVSFVSSSGIRFLLVASDRLRKNGGGDLLLAELQGNVSEVLAICGLVKRFQMFDTVEQAIGHLSRGAHEAQDKNAG